MKKFIAIILAMALVISVAVIPASAQQAVPQVVAEETNDMESAFAEGTNSLVVFVTGIGQSYSYLFDESYTQEGAFENGTLQDFENYAPLIAKGDYQSRWNLFNSFDEAFSDTSTILTLVGVVAELLFSSVIRTTVIDKAKVEKVIRDLFRFNLVGEDGNADPRVVTPRYPIPVSEFPGIIDDNGNFESEAKNRFYSSIPCKDIALEKFGENYEDYLYVFNYNAFSYTSKNVAALHDFVETIIANNKVGAEDIVLVPMSMGASVVTAYMDAYPTRAENHIRRVVSIVGAWDGSDVVADLLTQKYCENSADLFYNGLLSDLIGEPWGYVVNIALRLFPKRVLRGFVDLALGAIATELFCSTPSLCNLIPVDKFDDIKHLIKSDVVLAEAQNFQNAKKRVNTTMSNLEAEGVTFSFISGYGLPFGAITSDYSAFGFMESAPLTNSDEIINIDSTAPGTSYVTYGTKFEDTEGRILSPDGSLDISTTYRKDSSWFFYEQKHELEYNNTALALALELATGNVKTVADCDNLEEDGYYFPQFNGARNLKDYKRSYLPDLERYCAETGYVITDEQQAVLDKAEAMTKNTVNDYEADNAILEEVNDMLVEIGVYAAEEEPGFADKALNTVLKGANDITYKVFGAKGFLDFFVK
ncbi:MAG: hypothetical protein U0M02_02145 [Acutalibacteraceae bacterium]|nr:hypothetical protein [Acutalibacteraceae bacterium]